jgi:hypothetical protein
LDFDSISGTGDTSVLSTDLTNNAFTALPASSAGSPTSHNFNIAFDANNTPGTYSAEYQLTLSDADEYVGAESKMLTLTLSGTISDSSAILAGDYNGDGVVDGADFVTWRKSLTSGTPLANNETVTIGTTDAADYDEWRAHYGNVGALGSGAGLSVSGTAVPEPAPFTPLLVALVTINCGIVTQRRRAGQTIKFAM